MLLFVCCLSAVLAHAKLTLTNAAITFGSANITYSTDQVLLVDGISVRDLAAKLAELNATVTAQSNRIRELQELLRTTVVRLEGLDSQSRIMENFTQKLERHFQARDRLEWSLSKSAGSRISGAWYSLAYGNGMFVAVGSGSSSNESVMSSSDGRNWTIRRTPVGCNWEDIAFGGDMFVAVGSKGGTGSHDGVMTSPDGLVWQPRGVARTGEWHAVAFGAGVFVALGIVRSDPSSVFQAAMFSADGISWTDGSLPANFGVSTYGTVQAIAYGQGLFMAVLQKDDLNVGYVDRPGVFLMSADDGRSWTILAGEIYDNYWTDITYGGSFFVAVAAACMNGRTCAMASADAGRTWAYRVPSVVATGGYIGFTGLGCSDDGLFVGVRKNSDRVLISRDGVAWEPQAIPSTKTWRAIAYGNRSFVVLAGEPGTAGSVLVSLLRDTGNGLCLPSLETCTFST